MSGFSPSNVSAVVCTMNSVSSIEQCLRSLRASGVGEIIVVDAHSHDGTRQIVEQMADRVLEDPGTGLGNARNIGIAETTGALILNMGSDNVMPPGQLARMIGTLEKHRVQGVSARTRIQGSGYAAFGLNAWRKGRFRPGPAQVIGTPTLFEGALLRAHPYDASRVFSDDSELCERWTRQFGARFAISDAIVEEVGKTSWSEVMVRCRMYGISDAEVFRAGAQNDWSAARKAQSALYPFRADFVTPMANLGPREAVSAMPFLATFTLMRYGSWIRQAWNTRSH